MFEKNNPDVRWENPNHPYDKDINPRPTSVVNWNKLIKWIFEDGLVTESKVLRITNFYRDMLITFPKLTEDELKTGFPMDKLYKIEHNNTKDTKDNISRGYLVYDMDYTIPYKEKINFDQHYDYDKGIAILETIHRETEVLYDDDKTSEKNVTNNAIKHFEVLIKTFGFFKKRVGKFLEDYVRPRARRDGRGKNVNSEGYGGWDGKWGAQPLLILMEKYRTHLNNELNKYRDIQNTMRQINRDGNALDLNKKIGGKKKVKSKISKRKTSKRKTSKRKTSKRKTSKKRGPKRKSRKN